jgi:hypothetical protein
VTYVKDDTEDNQKKEDEEEAKNNEKADEDNGKGDIKVNDQEADDDDDDDDFDDGGDIDSGTPTKKKTNADKEKLKEYNMLEPQIVVFRNALIEKGFTLSRNARTLEQIADEVARQVKR